MIYRLASLSDDWSRLLTLYLQQELDSINQPHETRFFDTLTEAQQALLSGECQIMAIQMLGLPLNSMPDGLVITAVSARETPQQCLVYSTKVLEHQELLGLWHKGSVGVTTEMQKKQLGVFRPDLAITIFENILPNTLVAKMLSMEIEACIVSAATVQALQLEERKDIKIIRFNVREFVPEVGQGVLAYITADDDLRTRRMLQPIHHKEVAEATNVERKFLSLVGNNVAAYCQRDQQNYYHLWAFLPESTRPLHYSSTISNGLPEMLLQNRV